MRALPARRIACSALCAALLAGTTGTAAMASDSAREPNRVVSPDTLLVQVRHLDARGGDLAPVADLLNAVLTTGEGRLPGAEARRLGEAAKRAVDDAIVRDAAKRIVEKAAGKAPAVTATATPTPTASVSADTAADGTDDLLDALRQALQDLLDSLLPEGENTTDQEVPSLDGLLTEVDELVDALTGAVPEASPLPAEPATDDASPSATATTLPALPGLTPLPLLAPLTPLTPLTSVLLPAS
ncbi:hypothetical protein AB0L35_00300 [Streptomyces sp. NPDC052309]|uniref:hypothetical protein n=1 Tax=Streptomyces sp. NPDC052309 TaxID=3155421 RepID=UPI003436D4F6